jgi:hypothetical protein
MRIHRFKKKLSIVLAALLTVSSVQWFAAPEQAQAEGLTVPISVQLNHMDSATNSTGDTVGTAGLALVANTAADYIKEGTGSKKWLLAINDPANPDQLIAGSAIIYPKQVPNVDLNGYETLKFWAYSVKARTGDQADRPIQLRFYMKGDAAQYYYYRIMLDWTGWKELEIPLSVVKGQKSSAAVKDWGTLDNIRFDQAGLGSTTLDPELNLYLDDFRLTNTGELHPAISDKPSGEYINKVTVSLSSMTKPAALAKLYYKREGLDDVFQLYASPLTLTENTTLTIKASLNGVDSAEANYSYTIDYRDYVEEVTAYPSAGTYAEAKTVTLASATEGAAIYYKIEGPDAQYMQYTAPFVIDHSQTVTTKAEFENKVSEEKSYAYNIDLSGSGSLPISDMENFTGWTNTTPVTEPAVLGLRSGRWTDPTTPINASGFTAPWNDYDQVEFWLYSEKASNKKVYFIIQTPDANVPGNEYFMTSFFVDWQGWKKIELPFNKFLNSNGSANFANFTQIIIHPRWYGSDPEPDPTDKLYVDGLALARNAVEPSIKRIDKSALPDTTLHYSFLLKNIGEVDTAYQLVQKQAFSAGYDVVYAPATATVAVGKETEIKFEVKVPASAQAGDAAIAMYTVKPLQGGKEVTIELNVKVGESASAAKQHPYVMLTQTQLNEAKAKLATYGWAQDYLEAIRVKADEWVSKTVYYPAKPAGQTTWFVCGDVTLIYNYDNPDSHQCPTDGQWYGGEQIDAGWRFTTHTLNMQAARNLAIVYALTGELKYASKAKEILLNYAELYPSLPMQPINGKLFYQSLDEAVQIIELAHAYDLIEPSGIWTAAEKHDVEQNLFAASAKTLQSYDTGKSNWQTWHNAAIGAIGAVLEDKSLMDFSVLGRSGFNFQMDNSVLSDGFWYEGAIGYHFYAQSALFHHAQALSNMGYDLFANSNFKKTFDVTLQYAFPDLGIINSNDSGKYPTNLAAPGRVVPMDYEGVYARYSDPAYGALLRTLYQDKGRPRGGFIVPGNTSSGIAGEQAVLYGKSTIESTGTLPSYSQNFTGLGHSVLRAGTGDNQLYALVDYGLHGGYHGHPDKLHLEVFGKGERLAPDLGIPPYSNSMYEAYYKKSFAHNTVMIDGETQAIPAINNVEVYEPTKLFLQSEPFNIMTNTSSRAYAGMDRYERTVAVTKDYMIDLFTLESQTSRQYDWIMHGIGEFTAGSEMNAFSEAIGAKDAYSFFRNGKDTVLTGPWEGAWRTENGNGLKLFSLTSSASEASRMIVGETPGPGNDTNVYTPTVINRVNGSNVQFVHVLEPFRGASQIESLRKTDASQVEVKLNDGRTQVFYYNNGEEAAGALQYYFVDGKSYAAENVSITASFADGTLSLATAALPGIRSTSVVVYAPEAATVLWNGKAVPFTADNGFVMVSVSTPASPQPEHTEATAPAVEANRSEKLVPAGQAAELALGQEIAVYVPADAVEAAAKYVIERLNNSVMLEMLFKGRSDVLSGVFEVTKDQPGLFKTPIKLRLKFDAAKLKEGDLPSIHYYDELTKQWVPMGGAVNGSYIEAESDHLTKFAVLAVAAPAEEQPELKDITGHWAEKYIREALQNGIVKGYEDGMFKPNQFVTRAEFIVMLMKAKQADGQAASLPDYTDQDRIGEWAKPAIAWAAQASIVKGYDDGSFRPGAQLTRAELALMLAKTLGGPVAGTESGAQAAFADARQIPSWALPAVAQVQQAGLMVGRNGKRFEPLAEVTRVEAIAVIIRLMEAESHSSVQEDAAPKA